MKNSESIFALLSHHAHIELERIDSNGSVVKLLPPEKTLRHNRYVTDMDWSSSQSKLATMQARRRHARTKACRHGDMQAPGQAVMQAVNSVNGLRHHVPHVNAHC